MHGEEQKKVSKIIVGDADSLIALAYQDDVNHSRAQKVSQWLQADNYEVIYPNTAILEAITALKRSLNLSEEAHLINQQYLDGLFTIEFVSRKVQRQASLRFEKTISKKNTIFDAIVAEVALELKAAYIFSFDVWYTKEGFSLAGGE